MLRSFLRAAVLSSIFVAYSFGQTGSAVHGVVLDPLGAVVPGAVVELVLDGKTVASASTDARGGYTLPVEGKGKYAVRASASTFVTTLVTVSGEHVDVTMRTPTATEVVTVTATGTETPLAQVASSVTVLESDAFAHSAELQEPLRFVPGVQMSQTGQTGGTSALYIRGGAANANKVLIDGIPVNQVGGAVEFGNISTAAVSRIEVLREPNSALYGSDALAGVVSVTTRRGVTPLPQLEYTGEGGNFGSYRQEGVLSGASHRLDYLSDFMRQDTGNSIASNGFHNATFAENVGYALNNTTDLRFTFRHVTTSGGQPNATALYGIPDAAGVKEQDRYIGAVLNSQTTDRWHNQLRYGGVRLNYVYTDYAPTGAFDNNAYAYLGAPVVIRGANGYSVKGQAIFQYPGTYPSVFTSVTSRDFVNAQTDYRITGADKFFNLTAVGGLKYEAERGSSISTGVSTVDRGNYSTMMELQGNMGHRAYFTVGSGIENNAVFGVAATPRASLGYYLVRPGGTALLSGTKLHASFSKGIKGPSVFQQNNSLAALLVGTAYHVNPVGAETSRSYDGGVSQELLGGKARVGLTYFHNEFGNGLEYVSRSALVKNFGIAAPVAGAAGYGAYVNSLAYRAQGLEFEAEAKVTRHLFVRAGYTLLDAKVQRSFSSSALAPVYNTSYNFSNVAIGAYGPLVGARPFRRARNTGYFGVNYTRSRWSAGLNGTLVGMRDDSTFLSDASYGNSLLLPNHNLDGAYQRLEATGSYRVSSRLTAFTEMQNLLSQHYSETFGYPSLPFNFRSGLKVTLGGESWRLK